MTKDDLEQIDQLLQKRLNTNTKQLRQELKSDIVSLRDEFRRDLKAEIDPIHERLDAQRDQIASVEKNLSAKISLEATDLAEIIRDAVFPKLDTHDKQIAELQEEVGIKPRQH